ncbi:MAG: UbiD family decarboxylase [Candidatus Eisenbacteria bacterium]|uniref:UbiD family decarboxylase n=1 Tax=Eiseniibacteriota bacterium TaxID=2212470 RepID=A0A538U9D8_UNCEI|nr:MAG: UbiD family decarboxylase [Candidatus Eisenbacteria bacterium]
MAGHRTLREFLDFLETRRDLKRVTREVDWAFEITEIASREARAEGPALLFENVKGSTLPLAVNVLAARRRIEWALGRAPAAVGAELEEILHAFPPKRLSDLWELRGSAGRVMAMRPQLEAVSREEMEADLSRLPHLQLWPKDGGRFVTFGLVSTRHPATAARNLGIYRMHVYDARTTGMHWQIGKGGGFHHHEAEKRGEPLEVAVGIGADPCTLLSAVAPLPEGIDELAFAGFLRGAPTRLTRGRRIGVPVLADAELVLEGVVPTGERRLEGPFGDHFGHYSHAAPFPVFHLQAMTRRERPIYQASVVGKPPQEDRFMGEAVQEFFTGVLKVIHPEIVDLWAYFEAGFHNLLAVAVENRFAKEARKTALGLMGTGQLSLTKVIVLVDGDVNPRDRGAVFEALARNFDPAEDFLLIPGVPLDTLDFTSYTMNLGSKMVLDAQTKPGRAPSTPLSEVVDPRRFAPEILEHRVVRGAILVAQARSDGRAVVERLVVRREYAGLKMVVAVSPDVPLMNRDLLLWGIFTRFDCARDVIPARVDTRGAWLTCRGPLGIDATWKEGYPEPVASPPEVVAKVDAWWAPETRG